MRDLSFESTQTVTPEEFAAYVEARPATDDARYELLNGRIIVTTPASPPHGAASAQVVLALGGFVLRRALGLCFESSQGFQLPSGDNVSPDFSFVSNERWGDGRRAPGISYLELVPDLVVEVVSLATVSRDRGEKKAIYEQNGVREYWVIDPRARDVTVFRRRAGRFDAGTVHHLDHQIESTVLEDLSLPAASLLG